MGAPTRLQLDPAPDPNFSGDAFVVSSDDGNGGTDVVVSVGIVPFNFGGSTLDSPIVFNSGVVSALNGATVIDNALVLSGGTITTASGTTISNAVVSNGGLIEASSSTLSGTTIEHGGIVTLDAASTATNGTVFGDEEVFGSAFYDSVGAGGTENVYGFDSGTTVENGGILTALTGSVASSLVDAGGLVVVDQPGSDNSATIFGSETVYGTAFGDTISSGGGETVSSGGIASNTSVDSSGLLVILSGGQVTQYHHR